MAAYLRCEKARFSLGSATVTCPPRAVSAPVREAPRNAQRHTRARSSCLARERVRRSPGGPERAPRVEQAGGRAGGAP
jgi:hypothetical protein